jgi:hypothetical protein
MMRQVERADEPATRTLPKIGILALDELSTEGMHGVLLLPAPGLALALPSKSCPA